MWEEVVKVLGGQYPAAVIVLVFAAIVYRHQRLQHQNHLASLEKRFEEQSKTVAAAYDKGVQGLSETIKVLQSERDAIRKERNSLRRELGRPVDEGKE
jgi:cell division protein FtsL